MICEPCRAARTWFATVLASIADPPAPIELGALDAAGDLPAPSPTDLSTAPLRNRIRIELSASPREVWALVGDLERLPEYSAGLERVEATRDSAGRCMEYVCHFRAPGPEAPSIVHREMIRWYEADRGCASMATEPNDFGLQHALSLAMLEPAGRGTVLTWSQYRRC